MKKIPVLLLFLLCAAATASRFEVVGLSGRQYFFDLYEKNSQAYINAREVCRQLNLTNVLNDTSFTVEGSDGTLRIYHQEMYHSIDADTISDGKKSYFLLRDSLYIRSPLFFSMLETVTPFYYHQSEQTVRISRHPADENSSVTGVVVLDPGHGGKDPGAIGSNDTYEKDVVLELSLKLRDYLETHSDITVYMTREEDVFIPLMDRTTFANEKEADLFLSIHANASPNNSHARGYKLYFLAEAETEMEREIARQENSVIEYEVEDDTDDSFITEAILSDMVSTEFVKESQDFTIYSITHLQEQIKSITELHTGVGQANFFVLRGAEMPAILVESAFISNPREEELLIDPHFQREFSHALGGAVMGFLNDNGGLYE
ncbi:MAG: N-acetylmuramoyl-L-alanine amidase family protein [Fibrobacterota bacterium]